MTLKVRARNTDPATSHAAATSIDAETLRKSQNDVYQTMKVLGRATDEHLWSCYQHMVDRKWVGKQSESGVRTRRKELVAKGLVKDSGQRKVLPSGRKAVVWEVTTWR